MLLHQQGFKFVLCLLQELTTPYGLAGVRPGLYRSAHTQAASIKRIQHDRIPCLSGISESAEDY
jgi:hypothetical protein